jgi:hypothetical protein
VAMAWISASWRYILSTLFVVGRGEAFEGLAATASAQPSLWLAVGATPLASAHAAGSWRLIAL